MTVVSALSRETGIGGSAMFYVKNHPVSIMVMYAVTLHLWWCAMIMTDDSAMNATPVNAIHRYVHSPTMLSGLLLVVAVLALSGTFCRKPYLVLLLVPQQIILLMSAAGVIEAVWLGQFADGVVRSRVFIATDQANSVVACIGHTAALIAHARRLVR